MSELAIVAIWCASIGGSAEVTLADSSRADCITSECAFEVEWGHKWKDGIGQSAHYALQTGLKPCLALINPTDKQLKQAGDVVFRLFGPDAIVTVITHP